MPHATLKKSQMILGFNNHCIVYKVNSEIQLKSSHVTISIATPFLYLEQSYATSLKLMKIGTRSLVRARHGKRRRLADNICGNS